MGFNLADYQPVEERNRLFWDRYPEGRILTALIFDDGSRCVFRAEVYTNRDDDRPAATGHAEEHVTNSGVNKTSALENCETSAEGRALARLGFAPKGARPSREEMVKSQRGQADEAPARAGVGDPTQARAALAVACEQNGWDLAIVAALFSSEHDGAALGTCTDALAIAKFRTSLFNRPQAELQPAVA